MLPRAGLRTLLGARHRVVRGAPSPRATLHHLAKRPPRRAPAPHHRVLSSKAKRDYYEVLGVPRSATAAYRDASPAGPHLNAAFELENTTRSTRLSENE